MNKKVYRLVETALFAALYVVLTMFVAPIATGPLQFRISEALMILPALTPTGVVALPLGVLLSHVLLSMGWIDIVFGTLATALAAIVTRYLAKRFKLLPEQGQIQSGKALWKKKSFYLLPLPAILFNAFIVGVYLPIFFPDPNMKDLPFYLAMILSILSLALSEALVVYVFGLPLMSGVYNIYKKQASRS